MTLINYNFCFLLFNNWFTNFLSARRGKQGLASRVRFWYGEEDALGEVSFSDDASGSLYIEPACVAGSFNDADQVAPAVGLYEPRNLRQESKSQSPYDSCPQDPLHLQEHRPGQLPVHPPQLRRHACEDKVVAVNYRADFQLRVVEGAWS